ncbi:hypothetical protein Nepgr_002866 [Nepenthes gracilis]|uniref:Uncharacterized protein n=1 Tax=Nepenthes gracilis TaxID=150966 RepID=A0AAD3PAD6_NEPGR|nr:hypothetical protein Nepgr_002866 [Nepenthes gracilis]
MSQCYIADAHSSAVEEQLVDAIFPSKLQLPISLLQSFLSLHFLSSARLCWRVIWWSFTCSRLKSCSYWWKII